MGWKAYLTAREADERRRRRERRNAEQQADALRSQAERMRAKATKAKAAQSMLKRADKIMASSDEVRRSDKVAALRFPEPKPCGRVPLMASGLSRSYGSLEVFTDVDLAIDRGSRVVILGLNGAGKTTLLRILAGVDQPDTGEVEPGHGAVVGYYAQEHETLDPTATVLETMRHAGAAPRRHPAAHGARLLPVRGRRRQQADGRAVGRREDPTGPGLPGRVGRQRPAAGRAHQQPRPGQPRTRCSARSRATRGRWSS